MRATKLTLPEAGEVISARRIDLGASRRRSPVSREACTGRMGLITRYPFSITITGA